jgi:hypothetical protein
VLRSLVKLNRAVVSSVALETVLKDEISNAPTRGGGPCDRMLLNSEPTKFYTYVGPLRTLITDTIIVNLKCERVQKTKCQKS